MPEPEGSSLWRFWKSWSKKDVPPVVPLADEIISQYAHNIIGEVGHNFITLEGNRVDTDRVVNQVTHELIATSSVVHISIPDTRITTTEQLMELTARSLKEDIGPSGMPKIDIILNLVEQHAQTHGQQVLYILDHIENIVPDVAQDLFAGIRRQYNKRAMGENRNITWMLVGMKNPNDLMSNKTRTPYNIGQNFTLSK